MIIALSPQKELHDTLHLEVNISTMLRVTAKQAKQEVTRFLMDNVSLLIHPGKPLLVIQSEQAIYWRFPLLFSLGRQGVLGQVGEVDVDAYKGTVLFTADLIEEIKRNAEQLAQRTTHFPTT